MRALFCAAAILILGSTAASAAWKYGSGPGTLLPAGAREFSATITNDSGMIARFSCTTLNPRLTFFAQLEPLPEPTRPKRGEGPPTIDFRVTKVRASWEVDGAKGRGGSWKRSGGIYSADEGTARAIFDAMLSSADGLVVTSGRVGQMFSAAGAGRALSRLAETCR